MENLPQDLDKKIGFGRRLAWFGAGFVLPFYSVEYYFTAIRKPLRSALLFFAAFMTLAAVLTTGRFSQLADSFRQQTFQAYQDGELPVITIKDGIASITGEDPFILKIENGIFIAADTTGALDREALADAPGGILVTKNTLVSYRNGRTQTIELSNYNIAFGRNPIVLDGELVDQLFETVLIFYLIVAGLAIWFWDVIIWFGFLAVTAFFIWGPIRQVIPRFSFRAVLIVGIYAHLPAFIVNHILTLFGVQIIFQYTILLSLFWIGALFLVLRSLAEQAAQKLSEEPAEDQTALPSVNPPRLWPALLGLPVLIFISANTIFSWKFAPLYVLVGMTITIAVLLLIDSLHNSHPEDKTE